MAAAKKAAPKRKPADTLKIKVDAKVRDAQAFLKKNPITLDKYGDTTLPLEAVDLTRYWDVPWEQRARRKLNEKPNELTLYYTERFKWVIMTLPIQGTSRFGPQRSYGISTNTGELIRAGNGPHVLKEIHVALWAARLKVLQPLLDLYNKGLVMAHDRRDDLSTSRAQGRTRRRNFFSF